jgi:hypothetical protein
MGPFVGKGTLDFPSDTDYISGISHFGGALTIDVVSTYQIATRGKINLKLLRNEFRLFGFKVPHHLHASNTGVHVFVAS